ncbi:hypothetical protein B0H17DRAFT_1060497 [Mycena rosella]|uniref:Antifreeze protein n=1 Tax=Mycena rosella TaxID=1033263 RepID=A0AAD7GG28_MYCRO|nr:hypothetical protein B0H17DRAFT_1060497 [Mycena rosella]
MLNFLILAGLLLANAVASPVTFVTSAANVTAAAGNTVRIMDTNNHQFSVDPGYPTGPEFSPVNGAPPLSTISMTNEDWILVPQDTNTFKIQSAPFPSMFLSYTSFGAPATSPSHSQLILRGNANAAIFSLQTISGGTTVNIMVPAIGKLVTSWTTTLTDTTTPITVTDAQAASTSEIAACTRIGCRAIVHPALHSSLILGVSSIRLENIRYSPLSPVLI